MRKIYYSILLLLMVFVPAVCAQSPTGAWLATDYAKGNKAQCTPAATHAEPMLVIEEDFSLFTAGSEEAPDATDITTSSFYVKSQYTHVPNWIGYNVHQAGGACALLYYSSGGYTGYGHISTPEMELYGDVVVNFRARRAYSNPSQGKLWLALCNNKEGVIESSTFNLTNEWTEYSWTVSISDFSPYCIFQFTPQQGEILVDDISLTRTRNIIPPVEVLTPINNSPTEFVARWTKSQVEDIQGYLLNVYYKDWPKEESLTGSMVQDFEELNLLADGKKIDTSNPGDTHGWTINVSKRGNTDVRTDEGFYSSPSKAIYFDAEGDSVVSPVAPAPINRVAFWIRPTTMESEDYVFSLVAVEIKHADGRWERIANVPNYWMEEKGGIYEFDREVLGDYIYQVRIFMTSINKVQFAIDDITLEYETQPIPYDLIVDSLVTDTCCVIKNIDPTKEHYYNVRAKEGDFISKPTKDMWVDGILGLKPEVLPATDVTENSFTANWTSLHNATSYKVELNQEVVAQNDNDTIELIHEDFASLTEGSILYPHTISEMVYDLNENGRTALQWQLTSPQWVNGMAGSNGTSSTGLAGLVVSPQIQVGNYPIRVDVTARNTLRSDTLWVMLIDDVYATIAVAGQIIPFPNKVGLITDSVFFDSFEWDGTPMRVAFMSQKGVKFYIDDVTISYIVPTKGAVVSRPYLLCNTSESSFAFENLSTDVLQYEYSVKAKRTKNFLDYVSESSQYMPVSLLPAAVEYVEYDNNIIYANGVVTAEGAIEVYNVNGMVVARGNESLDLRNLNAGVYIVRNGNNVRKVVR